IQYAPQTETVHAVPLLCCPPFINKYYIMDLAPGRSFIEWAVKNGHTTFCLSYRNPDASLRDVGFGDYLLEGPVEAFRVVKEITGAPKVNVAALCVGGTLATMLAAYLEATGDRSLNSLTLMNTLVDFSEPGPLGAFTDRPTIERMLRRVQRKGLLESHEMARTFNLLRPNDLYFNYFGSAWLMGDQPPGFDLLAWNDDGTRLPARLLSEYLRGCYLDNALARDEMSVGGKRLRLGAVTQDTFIVGAVEDHITPWRSAFRTTSLLGGKVQFVLSSSGHIAGVVNPPNKSAAYWLHEHLHGTPEAWQVGSTRHQDTWWHAWARWLEARAGERIRPPKAPGSAANPPLADAPGLYVTER
ncbi:MAG: PHA/PHB synthase family protein, partial [Myxococcaceae bacterium]